MARLESQARGGFYATPPHLVAPIAGLLEPAPTGDFVVVDPCAGEGDAVIDLVCNVFTEETRRACDVRVYVCEMEAERAEALKRRKGHALPDGRYALPHGCLTVAHGDAFHLQAPKREGASLAWINPPYDLDPVHGRLEERFLARFADFLCERGVLVLLVPFYALSASADTLAREFTDLRCYRFPAADFAAYKQVVLVATKHTPLLEPDERVRATVLGWAKDAESIPELPESGAERTPVPSFGREQSGGFAAWEVAPLDLTALLSRARPWHVTDRGGRLQPIASVVPDGAVEDLLTRRYPLAMPPRAAHIAAGIAAGIFNGARVEPDDPSSGLPPILVKGVFDREFVTIDEKHNKDGEKTGEVQVQQPRLVVTVLDLATSAYHTIKSSAERTEARALAEMTTADLLAHYGRGLMAVMLEQCPVVHDPARADHLVPLPELARPLYRAQAHAVMAAVKLLGGPNARPSERRGKAAFVLGEIGCGKSSVALATAEAIRARRVLIFCPPHLLDSWSDQAAAVVPGARVTVLREPADVDAFATASDDGMVLAIVSRETAKLGHGWGGVEPVEWARGRKARTPLAVCPACGALLPQPEKAGRAQAAELAKTRSRCNGSLLRGEDAVARLALDMALLLAQAAPSEPRVSQLITGRARRRLLRAYEGRTEEQREHAWTAIRNDAALRGFIDRLVARMASLSTAKERRDLGYALLLLVAATADATLVVRVARALYDASASDSEVYSEGGELRATARDLLLLLPPKTQRQIKVASELMARPLDTGVHYGPSVWTAWTERRDRLAREGSDAQWSPRFKLRDGALLVGDTELGAIKLAVDALAELTKHAKWSRSTACGEPLFQAIPEPRRYPLATYLARRHPRAVDLLVLDEGHELAGDGSAQGHAAHRLTGLGIPTLLLTGSVMNGYAESLFSNQWALDPEFRAEFSRDQRQEFVRRYGYLKQLVEDKDGDGKAVVFGAMSDRVERTRRTVGQAPGVLPLFLLRHLLRLAVTIHKADLALDLPPCREIVERIEPSAELLARSKRLEKALVERIRADRFGPDAGRLWGQMSELPSYLDRATSDTGNTLEGEYVIAYPESAGGRVVAREEPFDRADVLPKEQWMRDCIRRELDEGRNVMVFAWHEAVLPRLARLIEGVTGEPCPLLVADRVASAKRQAWIDREVIAKGRRTLVVNPVAVQTGLNNLVWFSTEVWMQNPGCNPTVYRQAVGRVDRIGKRAESRIYFPVYAGTTQEALHRLLMHKVAVSISTDGLDAQSALEASGVGVNASLDSMAVGRQLYEIIAGERRAPALPPTLITGAPRAASAPPRAIDVATRVEPARATTTPRRKAGQMDLFDMFTKGDSL